MISYPALLGRISGTLQIHRDQIIFSSEDDEINISMPLTSLQMSLEGLNSHHYYLYDYEKPDLRVCVQDESSIKNLAQLGCTSAQVILAHAKKRKTKRSLLAGAPFLISFGSLLAVPIFISLLPASWLSLVLSAQQEKSLGEWVLPMLKLQHQVQDDHRAQKPLEDLMKILKAANPELNKIDFKILVSKSNDMNAFAAPGNIIVINRGLIEKADSIEEVAGVMAHEMGHIEQKHTIKSLAGGVGSLFGTVLLATFIGYDAALVVANTTHFASLKHSRDDELQADKRGFSFLQNAKISTKGMVSFFDKLSSTDKLLPSVLTFASTHPASNERVKVLTQLSVEHPESTVAPLPVSLDDLKKDFYE